MVTRGDLWWAELPDPVGAGPGFRRPVAVVQADRFNQSRIRTVVVVPVTSNLARGADPGNVILPAGDTGLPRDSVAVVSQVYSADRDTFIDLAGRLSRDLMDEIDDGLRLALDL